MKSHLCNHRWGKKVILAVVFLLGVCIFSALFTPYLRLQATDRFITLPPGARLQSESYCASQVRPSSWEPRPENFAANHSVPSPAQIAALAPWTTASQGMLLGSRADTLRKQIRGNFTGTTDMILQWVACKWGIDENIIRAEAIVESHWMQSHHGDISTDRNFCPPGSGYSGAWNGASCYQSYGILQIKYIYNKSAWPMSRDDTAFSIEYTYGVIRSCYEGWATYLRTKNTPVAGYPFYHAGDIWGCIGRWYSGQWYSQDALTYIGRIKKALAQKPWLNLVF